MIPGLNPESSNKSKRGSEKRVKTPPFASGLTPEEKFEDIFTKKRFENYSEDVRRSQIWYRMALAYQGYYNIEWNLSELAWDVYDDEPCDYVENQFRKDVVTNMTTMIRNEAELTIRPGSDKPGDIAAARAAEHIRGLNAENVDYDAIKVMKSLYKCLFGNAFMYTDYQVDRKFGTILVPKFKFDSTEIPGMAICPDCGMTSQHGTPTCPTCPPSGQSPQGVPMDQTPPETVDTKMEDGYETKNKGSEIALACSPLEVKCRSKVKGGLKNQPYLFWISREDIEAVQYAYPDVEISGTWSEGEKYNSSRYLDNLPTLPGSLGSEFYYSKNVQYQQAEVARCWFRCQCFRGDKELEKAYPDGARAVFVNGKCVELSADSMDDHWTHEVYLVNPHSFFGDGMYDALPVQREINKTNELAVRTIDYASVPLTLIDDTLFGDIETKIKNDPSTRFIPIATSSERGIAGCYAQLPPAQLSVDFYQHRQHLGQAMQDMTGANDPSAGKDLGANTPYSAYVYLDEKTQGRFLPSAKFNAKSLVTFCRQLLEISRKNWVDERTKRVIDNTGKYSFMKFTGASLDQGSFDIRISDSDSKPKTRAQQMQSLDAGRQLGLDPTADPKQLMWVQEILGWPVDANPYSLQAQKASRNFEKIVNGQDVAPRFPVDDMKIHEQVFRENLVSEEGEALEEENPDAFARAVKYMETCMQINAMAQAQPGLAPAPPQSGQPGPGQPGQPKPPQGKGGPSAGPKQEMAQSPVGPQNQVPMPALPEGAR